ncbi:MAG: T9SS type A sorting domain-containing protein [Bacteroidales bacterium]|nr:T9SS type A sorting domain-containing protein [Bacteroidales bacterium]
MVWTKNKQGNLGIDISHPSAGIYFVRIQTENGVVTRKVVKE